MEEVNPANWYFMVVVKLPRMASNPLRSTNPRMTGLYCIRIWVICETPKRES